MDSVDGEVGCEGFVLDDVVGVFGEEDVFIKNVDYLEFGLNGFGVVVWVFYCYVFEGFVVGDG